MREPCTQSVVLTTVTTPGLGIVTGAARLCHIMLHPGSATSTVTIYDNATATSGTVLALLQGVANGSSVSIPLSYTPVLCKNGISAVVTGTAATAQIFYQLGD